MDQEIKNEEFGFITLLQDKKIAIGINSNSKMATNGWYKVLIQIPKKIYEDLFNLSENYRVKR